jgi:catechol 2,3-dioxygenase-like lactoylglutathione lyase family enzyme
MIAPDGIAGLNFHHVGVACRDLDREAAAFAGLGYRPEGADFEDPIQGIRGRFLTGTGPRIELVTPLGDEPGVLTNMLEKGHKMYHLAFTTGDMERSLAEAAAQRGKLVVGPVPAVAFGGRRIAFLFLKNMLLLELIER